MGCIQCQSNIKIVDWQSETKIITAPYNKGINTNDLSTLIYKWPTTIAWIYGGIYLNIF